MFLRVCTWVLPALLLIFCSFEQVWGSRVVAADMTYRYVGPNQYEFTLAFYQDCSSPIPMEQTQDIYFSSRSTNPAQTRVTLTLQGGGVDISPICPTLLSTCRGGTQPGVQRYIYKGILTLPGVARDWIVYFRECNRSNGIETIRNPGSTCLYIEAGINNQDAPTNSSPVFSNDAISYVCAQTDVTLNGAAQDPNNNRLLFRLITPRTNTVSPVDPGVVEFVSPYSATNPLPTNGGFGFDSLTGTISFNATRPIRAVTAQRVEEYDNRGRLIGYIMRDVQLYVQACSNALPRLSGINGQASNSITLCANTPVQLRFTATDSDPRDSVRISVSTVLPGAASFYAEPGVRSSTGILSWNPTSADTGIKYVTLVTRDNSCPQIGITSATYTLRVLPGPIASLRSDTTLDCGTRIPVRVSFSGGTPPYTIRWLGQPDTTRLVSLTTGQYLVTVTDANGCASSDGLNLGSPSMQATFRIDSTCVGHPAVLIPTVTGIPPGSPLAYQWYFPGNQVSSEPRPRFNFGAAGVYPVSLLAIGPNHCEIHVSKNITICEPPRLQASITGPTCQGDRITMNIQSSAPPGSTPCSVLYYDLRINNQGNISGNPPFVIPANLQVPDTNRVVFTAQTAAGCTSTGTLKFVLKPKPQIAFSPRSIYHKCDRPDTLFRLKVWRPTSLGNLAYRVVVSGLDTNFTTAYTTSDTVYFRVPVRRVQTVTCRAEFTNGCAQTAQASVLFPFSGSIASTPYCKKGDTVRLSKSITARWPIRYFRWDLGNGDTSRLNSPVPSYPEDSSFQVSLFLRDSTGCIDTLYHAVSTKLPDTTAFVVGDTVCYRMKVALKYPNPDLIQNWHWAGLGGDSANFSGTSPSDSLRLTTPGRVPISIRIRYKNVCVKSWIADSVFVRNKVGVGSTFDQVCAYNPSRIEGLREVSDYPIQRWYWAYGFSPTPNTVVARDTGRIVSRTFNRNGELNIRLQAYDTKGCPGWDTTKVRTVLVSLPEFDVKGLCERDSLLFFYGRVPDQYENIRRFIYNFGDGTTEENNNGQAYHVYPTTGRFTIRLSAFSQEGCLNTDSAVLDLKPRPTIVFSTDPSPCANFPVVLDASASRPTVAGDSIRSYRWMLNRDSLASGPRATVQFQQPGQQVLMLVITAANGCRDSVGIPLLVRARPQAGFTYDIEEAAQQGTITFADAAQGATRWRWRFGDGDSLITDATQSPVHAYRQGGLFDVRQIVENGTGCSDTLSARLELRSFIALPDAFSPNGDGQNDDLKLRHRLLRRLEEYRIYNRFGQAVFTSSDPDKVWDGKIGGQEAPVGTYVYIVKATTVFGEQLDLKGNLQLLR